MIAIAFLIIIYNTPHFQQQQIDAIIENIATSKELLEDENYSEAIKILYHSLDNAIEIYNDTLELKCYISLGTAHSLAGNEVDGISYYRKALKKSIYTHDSTFIIQSYFGLGAAYQKGEKYDSSIFYYRKLIPVLENQDSLTLSYIYDNLAHLFSSMGDNELFKSYNEKALIIHKKRNNKTGLAAAYFNKGRAFAKNQEYDSAIFYYNKSLPLQSNEREYVKILYSIARDYYHLKRYDSSAYYFIQYDSINHNIFHDDGDEIRNLERKYLKLENLRKIEAKQNQFNVLFVAFCLSSLLLISTILFINQRRRRIKIEFLRKAEKSKQETKDLLQNQEMKTTYALLEGQDKERKRIAAELHDNLGSILVTLNMYADTLQNKKPKDIPALALKIAEVSQLANEETRKISHSLDSGMLRHFGLEAAIKQLTEAVSSARKIKFNLSLQTGEISSDASIEIYRIIQELVNNTLKHAQCSKVHLELTHVDHSLSIIYEDNGIGFNPKETHEGMGLKNIQNRAAKLDGELTIDSTPGKGSSFIIEIPHL